MGLDCVITVKGSKNGGPGNGNTKEDRTKPVSDFICGSEILYRAVYKHVKGCDKCDPQEVLEAYLSDRRRPKLGGMTSRGLVQLAMKYQKNFPGRVKDETVREFMWRIGLLEGLEGFAHEITTEEFVSGILLVYRSWIEQHEVDRTSRIDWDLKCLRQRFGPHAKILLGVVDLWQSGMRILPDRSELLNLATVATILAS